MYPGDEGTQEFHAAFAFFRRPAVIRDDDHIILADALSDFRLSRCVEKSFLVDCIFFLDRFFLDRRSLRVLSVLNFSGFSGERQPASMLLLHFLHSFSARQCACHDTESFDGLDAHQVVEKVRKSQDRWQW